MNREGHSPGDALAESSAPPAMPMPSAAKHPFLSVVMRSQGRRADTLRDALLALTSQSCTDFEVVLIGHKTSAPEQAAIARSVEQLPGWMRPKVGIHRLDRGNRTAPLNAGFALAAGDYIAILDDDDLPFGNWVETFHTLSKAHPGHVLRAACLRQTARRVTTEAGEPATKFIDSPLPYPPGFGWIHHLSENQTPAMSVAFPRRAFHDLGIRFDEELTTLEDWDFLLQVAAVCGVASAPVVTAIYRWWAGQESSRTLHRDEEWQRNRQRVLAKLDSMPCALPAGALADIRRLYEWARNTDPVAVSGLLSAIPEARAAELHTILRRLLNSSSWKLSAPIRSLQRLFSRRKPKFNLGETCPLSLHKQIEQIYGSLSWRVTRPLRAVSGGRTYDRR
jgi:hypothetical protein